MDSGFYDLINDLFANGLDTDAIASQFTNTLNAINEDRRLKEEAAAKAKAQAKAKEQEMIADARNLITTMANFLTKWNICLPLGDPKEVTDEEILGLVDELRSLNGIMDFIDDLFKKDDKSDDDRNIAPTPVKAKPHKIKISLPNPDEFAKIFRAFLNS